MRLTEEEKQERFIRKVGVKRADRLQYIWNNSFPHGFKIDHNYVSREEDFRRQAKREGFTIEEIAMFLSL